MIDHAAARTNMVDCQIHPNGVVNPHILKAFETIPREIFVPEHLRNIAYFDEDIEITPGRYLLDPTTHAKMVEAVKPEHDDIVLDIGTGTGYSAAIFSSLVSTVLALDENQEFLDYAGRIWSELGACNIVSVHENMSAGDLEHGPFNLIFMNGAVPEIPQNLVNQLTPDGRLITIIKKPGEKMGQVTLVKPTQSENAQSGSYSSYTLFSAAAHYLPSFEPAPAFQF